MVYNILWCVTCQLEIFLISCALKNKKIFLRFTPATEKVRTKWIGGPKREWQVFLMR